MKIIFFGNGLFSLQSLVSLHNSKNHELCLVVTNEDKKIGRNQKIKATPIKKIAIKENLNLIDRDLINRNPTWGLKDIDEIQTAAENKNLYLDKCIDMPANNFSLIFTRK